MKLGDSEQTVIICCLYSRKKTKRRQGEPQMRLVEIKNNTPEMKNILDKIISD